MTYPSDNPAARFIRILACLLWITSAFPMLRTSAAQETYPGERQGPRETVAALGRLEPDGEVIEVAVSTGDRVSRILVTEGDRVASGEILAYLESFEERSAQKKLAETRLAEARKRLEAETAYARKLVDEAEIQVQQIEEIRPLEIRAQQASVDAMEAELEASRKDLQRLENLAGRDSAARQELDHQVAAVRSLEANLSGARVNLERLIRTSETDLRLAKAKLETARATRERAVSAIETRSLEANLRVAEAILERAVVRAPRAGTILRLLAHPGEGTWGSAPLLRMGDTSQMYAVTEVYETDIGLVEEGQSAEISSPALAGKLSGTVTEVGRIVTRNEILDIDPAADTDRRVVRVKIKLDPNERAARLVHLQVTVSIKIR